MEMADHDNFGFQVPGSMNTGNSSQGEEEGSYKRLLGDKEITWFWLMQHYSKANAEAYKRQKEAKKKHKKGAGSNDAQKAQMSPSDVQPVLNGETVANQNNNYSQNGMVQPNNFSTMQNGYQSGIQQDSQSVYQQNSGQQAYGNQGFYNEENFGNTIVLDNGSALFADPQQGFQQSQQIGFQQNSQQGFQQKPQMRGQQSQQFGVQQNPQFGFQQSQQSGFQQSQQSGFQQNPQTDFQQNQQSGFQQSPQMDFLQNQQSSVQPSPQLGFQQSPQFGFQQNPQHSYQQVHQYGQPDIIMQNNMNQGSLFNEQGEEQYYAETSMLDQDYAETSLLDQSASNATLFRVSNGATISISKTPFILGRNPKTADYLFSENTNVSGTHAKIGNIDGVYYIEDTSSKNGVYLDGFRIPQGEKIQLADGMEIKLGDEKIIFRE